MSACLIETNGVLSLTADTPQTCTGYLVLSQAEFTQATSQSWLALSAGQGAVIATAIISAWTLAFIFRMLRKQMDSHHGELS